MAQDNKKEKDAVHYRRGLPNYRCGMCVSYRTNRSCQDVAGQINPDYVCDLFDVTPTDGFRGAA